MYFNCKDPSQTPLRQSAKPADKTEADPSPTRKLNLPTLPAQISQSFRKSFQLETPPDTSEVKTNEMGVVGPEKKDGYTITTLEGALHGLSSF